MDTMTTYSSEIFDAMTEAEKTSNVGCTYQPGDRVTRRYGVGSSIVGTVLGNRYFGGGSYGVLVRFDNADRAYYVPVFNLRRA